MRPLHLLLLAALALPLSRQLPPPKASPNTQVSDTLSSIVYITKSGKKYHLEDCHFLGKSKLAISRTEATKYYEACKRCRPDSVGR